MTYDPENDAVWAKLIALEDVERAQLLRHDKFRTVLMYRLDQTIGLKEHFGTGLERILKNQCPHVYLLLQLEVVQYVYADKETVQLHPALSKHVHEHKWVEHGMEDGMETEADEGGEAGQNTAMLKWEAMQLYLLDGVQTQYHGSPVQIESDMDATSKFKLFLGTEVEQVWGVTDALLRFQGLSRVQVVDLMFTLAWFDLRSETIKMEVLVELSSMKSIGVMMKNVGLVTDNMGSTTITFQAMRILQWSPEKIKDVIVRPKIIATTNLKLYMRSTVEPPWVQFVYGFATVKAKVAIEGGEQLTIAEFDGEAMHNDKKGIFGKFKTSPEDVLRWLDTQTQDSGGVPTIVEDYIFSCHGTTWEGDEDDKVVFTDELVSKLNMHPNEVQASLQKAWVFKFTRAFGEDTLQTLVNVVVDTQGGDIDEKARSELLKFAVPVSLPDNFKEYRIDFHSLLAAYTQDMGAQKIMEVLRHISKNNLSDDGAVAKFINEQIPGQSQRAAIVRDNGKAYVETNTKETIDRLRALANLSQIAIGRNENLPNGKLRFRIGNAYVYSFKKKAHKDKERVPLLEHYYYEKDKAIPDLEDLSMRDFITLRDYQKKAVESVIHKGTAKNSYARSGVVVLPCGAGKTVTGIQCIACVKKRTLILVPNDTLLRQWVSELLKKTTIGSVITYNAKGLREWERGKKSRLLQGMPGRSNSCILISKSDNLQNKDDKNGYGESFRETLWGMVVIDEVHKAPADKFSELLENLKSNVKIGLTATLAREDNKIPDIYYLVGPKLFEKDRNQLTADGYLEETLCVRCSYDLPKEPKDFKQMHDSMTKNSHRQELIALNRTKIEATVRIIQEHQNQQILILGDRLHALGQIRQAISMALGHQIYLIVGGQNVKRVQQGEKQCNWDYIQNQGCATKAGGVLDQFRDGSINILMFSKVGDQGIDLPSANVMIQVGFAQMGRSGQQEAQRLGRLMRPTGEAAFMYSLVANNTREVVFYNARMRFLMSLGYVFRDIQVGEEMDVQRVKDLPEWYDDPEQVLKNYEKFQKKQEGAAAAHRDPHQRRKKQEGAAAAHRDPRQRPKKQRKISSKLPQNKLMARFLLERTRKGQTLKIKKSMKRKVL